MRSGALPPVLAFDDLKARTSRTNERPGIFARPFYYPFKVKVLLFQFGLKYNLNGGSI
jgi:hypothetical protein